MRPNPKEMASEAAPVPTVLRVESGDGKALLTWDAVAVASEYRIQYDKFIGDVVDLRTTDHSFESTTTIDKVDLGLASCVGIWTRSRVAKQLNETKCEAIASVG